MWTMNNQQLLIIKIHDKYNKHFTSIKFGLPREKVMNTFTQAFMTNRNPKIKWTSFHKLIDLGNKYYTIYLKRFKSLMAYKN
jgi:hypothetical protein